MRAWAGQARAGGLPRVTGSFGRGHDCGARGVRSVPSASPSSRVSRGDSPSRWKHRAPGQSRRRVSRAASRAPRSIGRRIGRGARDPRARSAGPRRSRSSSPRLSLIPCDPRRAESRASTVPLEAALGSERQPATCSEDSGATAALVSGSAMSSVRAITPARTFRSASASTISRLASARKRLRSRWARTAPRCSSHYTTVRLGPDSPRASSIPTTVTCSTARGDALLDARSVSAGTTA